MLWLLMLLFYGTWELNLKRIKNWKVQNLKDEISRIWRVGEVVVNPVAVGVLGTVPARSEKYAEGTEIDINVYYFQKQR